MKTGAVARITGVGPTCSRASSSASAAATSAATGRFADGRHRKLHPDPCEEWGPQARYGDEVWEEPVLAQLAEMRLDDASIARVVATLGSAERPVTLDRVRLEKQMRELAIDHVEGKVGDDVYLERLDDLREKRAAFDEPSAGHVPAKRAVEWLRALGETWRSADVPEAKADLIHAIYERIVVVGREFVSARLTPAAYAHGLAVVLPEVVLASPAGFEPATGRLEGGCSGPLSYGDAADERESTRPPTRSTRALSCSMLAWTDRHRSAGPSVDGFDTHPSRTLARSYPGANGGRRSTGCETCGPS